MPNENLIDWSKVALVVRDPFKLHKSPRNIRIRNIEEDIDELTASIKAVGKLKPIWLDEKEEVVDGWRSVIASRKAGKSEIPCLLYHFADESDKVIVSFSTNEHQKPNVTKDKVTAVEWILKNKDATKDEIAFRFGVSPSTVDMWYSYATIPEKESMDEDVVEKMEEIIVDPNAGYRTVKAAKTLISSPELKKDKGQALKVLREIHHDPSIPVGYKESKAKAVKQNLPFEWAYTPGMVHWDFYLRPEISEQLKEFLRMMKWDKDKAIEIALKECMEKHGSQ